MYILGIPVSHPAGSLRRTAPPGAGATRHPQSFFNDVQALTWYLYFDNWQALTNAMFTRLELGTNAPSPPRKRAKR